MNSPIKMPQRKVAVVVATHAYYFPLEKCLADFATLVEDPRDVILVDNGSEGKMTEWAAQNAPSVTTLTREINGYFCGGYNEGLQYAVDNDYEYVLIVNADTDVCNPNMLVEMIEAAERHAQAAFIGPKVYLREVGNIQNTVLTFPNFFRNLTSFFRHKLIGSPPSASDDQEKHVEFLNGVCVLCRVDALREIGLLDETMGGYVEDTDWSWRAIQKGWCSVYTPVESIVHHQPDEGYEHYSLKSLMLRRNTIYWHHKRGCQMEAALYGWCSRGLAWWRAKRARICGRDDAQEFEHYSRRLSEIDNGIRGDRTLGAWFGPPIGTW